MNRNTHYAQIFIDELARSGLRHAVIAPGSRHTPLVLALAAHPQITVHSHLDERSAGFYALGLAQGGDQPVVLCCTSGTAGANFFPAVIEAHQSRVPLIVLTADRPPELRHSGANQTIDQIKLFGDYALWFVDAALPEAAPSALSLRHLRTTANRAYATATGPRKGVVHINLPFRKPLEPTPVDGDTLEIPASARPRDDARPFTVVHTRPRPMPDDDMKRIDALLRDHPAGIVIAGVNALRTFSQIERFASSYGYPLFADAFSGLRFGGQPVIGGYDTFLAEGDSPRPDLIVRFGDLPLSKAMNQFIASSQPRHYLHFSTAGRWADDSHLVTQVIDTQHLDILEPDGLQAAGSRLMAHYTAQEATAWRVIADAIAEGDYFDGGVVHDLMADIPAESTLFVGNSLPVRLLDQFGQPTTKRIHAFANRGASGIDGNLSTALGLGKARPDHPLVALVGDVTFYHDMNGLLAVHRCGVPVTIVLLNNDGGGIFHRLPIREYDPAFTDLFVTPHGLDFSHAARLYGLDFVPIDGHAPDARARFRSAFTTAVGSTDSTIIEIRTQARHDLERRRAIMQAVQAAL
jgi:2-succinyl-5-enolpyruvyl-6-hydroxy-3-cyclohexene-1-carboxylate synthase